MMCCGIVGGMKQINPELSNEIKGTRRRDSPPPAPTTRNIPGDQPDGTAVIGGGPLGGGRRGSWSRQFSLLTFAEGGFGGRAGEQNRASLRRANQTGTRQAWQRRP